MDVNLVLFKKNGSQKSFALPSTLTVIGRRNDCDLCIPLMRVSRRHCELNRNDNTLKIRDLGSHNGTFLNGEQIDGETTLKAGDYLKIGPLVFQLRIDGEPEKTSPPRDISPEAAPAEDVLLTPDEEEGFSDFDLNDSDSFLADLEEL